MGKSFVKVSCFTYLSLADAAVAKQLVDKIYEKRKAAALELEKYFNLLVAGCNALNVLSGRFANVTCRMTDGA
jgi:hypothetical protein